jgi:hypothetical protein
MTEHRSFKKLVRSRMAKTGESYTAARARLLAADDPAPVLVTTDARIRERTGRGWEEWFDLLDGEGLAERPHREISRRVAAIMELDPLAWNVQAVTTSFERARGGKAVGEKTDGFSVSASKTLPAPADRVFDLVADPDLRATWLGADLVERTATRPRRARFDHADGRVAITIDARDDGRCVLAVEHSRLADAALAATTKAWWRDRLAALATRLEARDV